MRRRELSRARFEAFVASIEPTTFVLEASGGADHRGRIFEGHGHRVRLIPPQYIKPFVKRGKSDRAEAQAICEAAQLLEDGISIRATDMSGADDQILRIYAAMAQKARELISERTRATLAVAKARGRVLGVDRGYRPPCGPDAGAAAPARLQAAERAAHRLGLELDRLRGEGVAGHAAMARALNERAVPTPRGVGTWTHTTLARIMAQAT